MRSFIRIQILALVVMMACIGMASAAVMTNGTESYYHVKPILKSGNAVTCAEAGCSGTSTLFIDAGTDGTYDGTYCIDKAGKECITIDANKVAGASDENSINWTSTFDVKCIVLKGADGYDTYYCTDDHMRADMQMSPPIKPSNNRPYGISHIMICYVPPIVVPEFPSWFLPIAGIVGLVALALIGRRD